MKTSIKLFIFSALVHENSANLVSLESLYDRALQLIELHKSSSEHQSEFNRNGNQRNVAGTSFKFKNLQEYGCWCYFDDLHGQGRGIAQDGYDDACMALHHGIACAMLEIDNCDPRTEDHISAMMVMGDDGDIEYS